MKFLKRTRVLLTVSHLSSTASPFREMIAIAKYLPRDEFDLTICSLRKNGYNETEPILRSMGVQCIVARFRPQGHSWGYLPNLFASIKDQSLIDRGGAF